MGGPAPDAAGVLAGFCAGAAGLINPIPTPRRIDADEARAVT
jgi:hypothetical protein